MFALSDERGIFGHREPNNELCVYAALKVPADWSRQPISRDVLHQHFRGWHADFHKVLANSDGDLLPRSIWMLPEGHSWPRTPGVTLLGDAAHLMSPFAGEGANLAMIDGADLARAIIAHPNDIERAFAAYEATMFPRAREAAAESQPVSNSRLNPTPRRRCSISLRRRDEMSRVRRRKVRLRGGGRRRGSASSAQAATTPPLLRRPIYCSSANTPVAIACATIRPDRAGSATPRPRTAARCCRASTRHFPRSRATPAPSARMTAKRASRPAPYRRSGTGRSPAARLPAG